MKSVANIFVFIICVFLSSCQQTYLTPKGAKTYQKPIDIIYVYHEAFGQRFPEYKIDLRNKQFLEFTSDGYENFIARDSLEENEGFTFVCDLVEDKIETFTISSSRYGFTHWKDKYNNENILDGHQWGILIVFSDSTKQSISGSNKYPETWDKMLTAFEELTGKNILIYNNDWND